MDELIVLTAANRAQAESFRAQLKGRGNVLVVPDPHGRRAGSLGATVNALRLLKSPCRRVVICHSGGDARRTVAYAANGKAFVPMRDGRPLLDHILDEMAHLPRTEGVLVCCGDVIPYFDASGVRFATRGVTGLAFKSGPWEARRHGVYVLADGGAAPFRKVTAFLQKPQVSRGTFLIDTGILHIDWETAERMKKLEAKGDIYEDFPKLLLSGFAPFYACEVPSCRFFHIGSSRELLRHLGKRVRSAAVRGRVLVDGVQARIARLDGDNIVTNVPKELGPVSLEKGECLTALPLKDGSWYSLKYGIDDTFKGDGLWERHGLGEKMREIDPKRLMALKTPSLVRVTRPLRLDLAGGWSDTPPICFEVGGAVLNAAVCLEGGDPVVAEVERIAESEVRVTSVDLGKRGVLTSRAEIDAPQDPHDWCALVKSALKVVGYDFGEGGLEIRIRADVPKGSGMGTSSILGSALIEALVRILDRSRAETPKAFCDEIAILTMRLEQVMQTGGGWEDQMGALYPGVKLIETKPGRDQAFRVRSLSPRAQERAAQFIQSRGVLYFTGQKRMARNVLKGVLSFYAKNPYGIAHAVIAALKKDARSAFRALERGDFAHFTAVVNRYWLNKKALDPGSTNAHVESIIARLAPWTEAVTLSGAGGGGFLFALAKSRQAKDEMLKVLAAAGGPGRAYRFKIRF